MKIRSDIVKVYKDVHIWVGILSGLMLFIAFYAGAITMFEKPLQRWATPPTALAPPPPMEKTQALIDAVLAAHPEAASNYTVVVQTTPEVPARVSWQLRGKRRGDGKTFGASFDADGRLQVEQLRAAPVSQLIDDLHQFVGLPTQGTAAHIIMGTVAMLYAIALVSGLIILLPTLIKDLFALRMGKNIKRMWLDAHNALGLVSLPFHLVIALTSVVFAFHDPFYDAHEKLAYKAEVPFGGDEAHAPLPDGAKPMIPIALLQRIAAQTPGLDIKSLSFSEHDGRLEGTVTGVDIRYGTRARTVSSTHFDPYAGEVDLHDLPGHMDGWSTAVNTFFMLHFGSFGGNAMRWIYLLMGLAGAMLFYTGNLLWIESRRKKARDGVLPLQKRNTRVLADLTIGMSLGCVAGISATLAATKWLPAFTQQLAAWHMGIYYAVFLVCIAWAFARGAARAGYELLYACAALTFLIPVSGFVGAARIGGTWHHGGLGWVVDLTALGAVPLFLLMARHAKRRMMHGHADSVWATNPPWSAGSLEPGS